jgi:5S rRNA maturation endonuclease (ribonuclease M5)
MNPADDRIELARAKLGSPSEVLEAHGIRVRRKMAQCPFHADGDAPENWSLSCYSKDGRERWRCHACAIGGDALDLEVRLSSVTLAELLDELAPAERPAQVTSPPKSLVPPSHLTGAEYMRSRGIVSQSLLACVRFSADRVWLLWLDQQDKEVYSSGRAYNGGGPKYVNARGQRPPLFATPSAWESSRVVLVEGQFDALAAAQAGIPAFATTTSRLSDAAVPILAGKDQVIIVADVDDAGRAWRSDVIEKLKGRVAIAEAKLPDGCKDLADVAAAAADADPAEAVFEILERAVVLHPGPFKLVALDWAAILKAGLPEIRYLSAPYVPAGARIWAFGPAESGKSLWALWMACALSRDGLRCVYVSQENPLVEDVRRLSKLEPDWDRFIFVHDQGLDLAQDEHVAALVELSAGADFIVLDTLTACWSGDEGDNPSIAGFDRDVLQRLIRETGASVVVLDHTGNPQAFVKRRGVNAGRGASSKGQKADVVLEFRTEGQHGFVIEHAKNRMGGAKEPPRQFQVVDADDGGLDVREVERSGDAQVQDCADALVSEITTAGQVVQKDLVATVKAYRRQVQLAALALLKAEDPPRVVCVDEIVSTGGGRQRVKLWRPAEVRLALVTERDEDFD